MTILAAAGDRDSDAESRPTLVVYGRPDCHLCDVAKGALRPILADLGIPLEERNVETRETWEELHGAQVPVGILNGRRIFKYRVDPERVRRALIAALASSGKEA